MSPHRKVGVLYHDRYVFKLAVRLEDHAPSWPGTTMDHQSARRWTRRRASLQTFVNANLLTGVAVFVNGGLRHRDDGFGNGGPRAVVAASSGMTEPWVAPPLRLTPSAPPVTAGPRSGHDRPRLPNAGPTQYDDQSLWLLRPKGVSWFATREEDKR